MLTKKEMLKTVYLHLTKRCNLNCNYCYYEAESENRDEELDLNEFESLFYEIVKLRPEKLVFTGGEALLRNDLFDVAASFRKISKGENIRLVLMSNGTLINMEKARNIVQSFDEIRISLDGVEEINDSLRGKGSFEKAHRALFILSAAGISPRIQITLTSVNLPNIEEFIEYILKVLPVRGIHMTPFKAIGKGESYKEYLPDSTGIVCLSDSTIASKAAEMTNPDCRGQCIGQYINIMHDGSVYPCHVLRQSEMHLGNVRRESLADMYKKLLKIKK